MKYILSGAILFGLAMTATAGYCRDARVEVSYADLDLGGPAGQTVLMQRITAAAEQVCGADTYGRIPLEQIAAERSCIASAKQRAIAALPHRAAEMLQNHEYETAALAHD